MLNLPGETWIRFAVWMVARRRSSTSVYGRRHSRFTAPGGREDAAAAERGPPSG